MVNLKSVSGIDISEIVKNYAQVGAWLAGGLFFLVKLLTGYFAVDLSVTLLPTRRASGTDGTDHLVAEVTLKKGDRGSFSLLDAMVIVTQGQTRQNSSLRFQRFRFKQKGREVKIDPDIPSSRPTFDLSPGESVTVSTWLTVETDQPCLVEVAVIGTGRWDLSVKQRYASAVSLPRIKRSTGAGLYLK